MTISQESALTGEKTATRPFTGAQHLESLRDGREVYIYGERVKDVTVHPAFRNSVASAAYLYDFQSCPQNLERMTFKIPDTAARVSRAWQLPTTYAELVARREAVGALLRRADERERAEDPVA